MPSAALMEAPAWGGKKKKTRKAYFVLQPDYGTGTECNVRERNKPAGCHACKACHRHAKNKLFATRRAAENEKNRAHPGCKCKVMRGGKFKNEIYVEIFGGSLGDPKHKVVDRRKRRIRRILNRVYA